jgi:hypothetical protein
MRRLLAFGSGLAAGVVVTRQIHARPPTDFWAQPVGTLAWRRGDLPVGGVTALALSAVAPRPIGRWLRPAGLGAVVGCLAVAFGDPLRA